jgi:hypothetical protein
MSGSAQVIGNIKKWQKMKKAGIEGVARVTAANATNYAKERKSWIDQTGNARAGLHGGFYWESWEGIEKSILKVFVAHSMEYGIYLELAGGGNKRVDGVYVEMANDGRYAILQPTIRKFQDSFFKGVDKIVRYM